MSVRSSSTDVWVVGIDDTDMPGVGGTGSLARRVASEIEVRGLGTSTGVTRHQFFEGPGVPKTSRNSAAAIGVIGATPSDLFEAVCTMVAEESIDGSDPGVALVSTTVPPEVVAFARETQRGLVTRQEAERLAADSGIDLAGLGGTEDGVIGALGAAALRVEGTDGRYVGLRGIRDVAGIVSVGDLLDRTGIAEVVRMDQSALERGIMVDVGDWLRPRLVGGRPVLVTRRDGEDWVNADSRPK